MNCTEKSRHVYHKVETISLEIDKCKAKDAAWVSEVLVLLSWNSEGYI